jgi:hypothetical protein
MPSVRIIANCCIDHDNICYTSDDGWFNLPCKVAKYFESKGSVEIKDSNDEDVILESKALIQDDLDDIDFDSICTEEVAKEKKQKKNRRRKKN